jgi:hypothetical protein
MYLERHSAAVAAEIRLNDTGEWSRLSKRGAEDVGDRSQLPGSEFQHHPADRP